MPRPSRNPLPGWLAWTVAGVFAGLAASMLIEAYARLPEEPQLVQIYPPGRAPRRYDWRRLLVRPWVRPS